MSIRHELAKLIAGKQPDRIRIIRGEVKMGPRNENMPEGLKDRTECGRIWSIGRCCLMHMNPEIIIEEFRQKICSEIQLLPEGLNRYRVFTPFQFDDGDHFVIVLKKQNDNWILTDEGHTYMHLTYSDLDEKDLTRGTRGKIIENTLSMFSMKDEEGELTLKIHENEYGDALYSFIQGLAKISDVTYLARERVASTFMEDLYGYLNETVLKQRRTFDWHDPVHDPDAKYVVDCRINGIQNPIFIFGLLNDDKVLNTTINILRYKQWGLRFTSIGIFEDQTEISRKPLAKLSDVIDKQFSNLYGNRDGIKSYLDALMAES